MTFAFCRNALLGALMVFTIGCVSQLAAYPASEQLTDSLAFGHIHVWQEVPSGRIYLPELMSLEFRDLNGGKRYRLTIESASSYFYFSLEPGRYQVSRVFMQEGGFRSSAEVPLTFTVPEQGIAYLGEWWLKVGPPNFIRTLDVAIFSDPISALVELKLRYPGHRPDGLVSSLAEPFMLQTRLFEITPYPRFRWFQRHNAT